jgi:hypothetical protein
MITNTLPVMGCWLSGSVILKVMLEAAAVADKVKIRKRHVVTSLVRHRSRFMVSPGELKGSIRRDGIVAIDFAG